MRLSVFGTVLTVLLAARAADAQVPAGGEFQVNDPTSAHQAFPSVAAAPGGEFVIVWADYASSRTLQARFFYADGVPRAPQVQVNTAPVASVQRPDVAVHASGRSMAVWFNQDGAGAAPGVFGRVFDAGGTALGPQFTINSSPGGLLPAVAATPAGFVVVWRTGDISTEDTDIAGRRFDVAGNPLGAEFQVHASTTGDQDAPSVAVAGNGRFVVVWASPGQNYTLSVTGQVFDASGARLGDEFAVGTASRPPDVAADALGNFVVVWATPQGSKAPVVGHRFDAGGSPLGEEFAVSTMTGESSFTVSVASDRAGNFTVAWDISAFPAPYGVFGRRFTADGAPRGAQFRVSSVTTDSQVSPEVAADASGNLIVAWTGVPLSPASTNVLGRRFGGLVPSGLSVRAGVNGVLEPEEDFTLNTGWRNLNGEAQTFQGRSSSVTVPPNLTMSVSADAEYGTVPNGHARACQGPCFTGRLSGQRSAGHADASVLETIVPDDLGHAQRWTLHIGDSFVDVPRASPYYRAVETLLHHGITGGCGAGAFCPSAPTTREQIAVHLLLAKEGAGYLPPACTTPLFSDVPSSSPFCPWIEELARRGVAAGCGNGRFCPGAAVTREQMAVFALRTQHPALSPPKCAPPNLFADVPETSAFCRWIEELARRAIVGGCGPNLYCPAAPVTREQMAVILAATFWLTLYGP